MAHEKQNKSSQMIEYGEITAARRSARLVLDAGKPSFSLLNVIVILVLILLVVQAIAYTF